MKIALAVVAILLTFAPRSCDAQQTRAQVSASVTVVEAIGVTAGATAVTQGSGGSLDVTTPLSIRGAAPRVVQVVDAERARPIAAQLCESRQTEACSVRSRLTPADAQRSPQSLTYLVATVN